MPGILSLRILGNKRNYIIIRTDCKIITVQFLRLMDVKFDKELTDIYLSLIHI